MDMTVKMSSPVTLEGVHVRLVPLAQAHHDALVNAVSEQALWQIWYTRIPSPDTMQTEIDRRLALQKAGEMLPFCVIDTRTQLPVGMTALMHIDEFNRRVEIGSTWYGVSVQRTPLNTEAKSLLLAYAFERLECIAVELRTHFFNHQSRRAIERLGAKLDGVLRSHSLNPDGTLRDTCVYSITAAEWPTVKTHLHWQLTKPRQPLE